MKAVGKHKKSGRKNHSSTEKFLLATAALQLLAALIDLIKHLTG